MMIESGIEHQDSFPDIWAIRPGCVKILLLRNDGDRYTWMDDKRFAMLDVSKELLQSVDTSILGGIVLDLAENVGIRTK